MATIEVTFQFTQELVEKANEAGLLTSEKIAALLEAEIKRWRIQRFKNMLQQIRSLEPAVTQEEIDAEIEAYRAERSEPKA